VRIEYQDTLRTNIRYGFPVGSEVVNYGRVVTSNSYSIGGVTYQFEYNIAGSTWKDASGAIIAVEEFNYDNTWYYKFGQQWFKYINGIFVASSIPYGHSTYSTGVTYASASSYQAPAIQYNTEAASSSSGFLAPVGNGLTAMGHQSSASNSGTITYTPSAVQSASIVQNQNNMSTSQNNPFSFMGFNQ
jgi:hypothetical protein